MLERIWKRYLQNDRFSLWSLLGIALWPFAWLYWLGSKVNRLLIGSPIKIDVPVISVGNITVGGTGKTPLVEFIASDLLREGYKVGIVSSGYGRADESPLISAGYKLQRIDVSRTGDEVKQLADRLPEAIFSIDRSKSEAARRLANEREVDLIIVDDGFQHFKLARDLDIIAYDAAVASRTLKLFPRGLLREPKSSICRADIVIITRADFATDIKKLTERLEKLNQNADYYQARFSASEIVGRDNSWSIKYLEDKSVYLFAGIGNFAALKRQVIAQSADLDYALELADHQQYDQSLLERIRAEADELESDLILTTNKDWVKLGNFDFGRECYYLNQVVDLDPGEEKLISDIKRRLGLPELEN